jgi:thiol:disulfide interchange protein DsbD
VSAPHVTVELISSSATVSAPGAMLGLRFILEPDWHVYWLNPGDSGEPPTVFWNPPAGLEPGEFLWPAPERIPVGQLVNYGYHGDVVLPFRIAVATGTSAGTLEGRASWLLCKDICVPGKARLGITFPLTGDAAAAVPAWKQMLADATGRVPAKAPSSWRVEARDAGETVALTIITGRRETGGTFFPLDMGIIADGAPQSPTPLDGGIRFSLDKSDFLTTTPATLRGLVSLDSGATHVVSAPVRGASHSKGRTQ